MTPLVSICCITYNHEKFIEDAIKGFLMQKTDFLFEIIIGEDFSTDKTREICLKYQEKFPDKIKVIIRNKNVGGRKNLIFTFNEARGKYIALCEGDDFWTDPFKLQKQINEMKKNDDCDLSFHSALMTNYDNGEEHIVANYGKKIKIFKTEQAILGDGHFCPTASMIFKKKFFLKIENFFSDFHVGDYPLQIFGSVNGVHSPMIQLTVDKVKYVEFKN